MNFLPSQLRGGFKPAEPPGTLTYVGPRQDFTPTVVRFSYGPELFQERALTLQELESEPPPEAAVNWYKVNGIHNPELVAALGGRFDLHPLLLEDVMNTHQRPKAEVFEPFLFVSAKIFGIDPDTGKLSQEQVSLALSGSTLISFQEADHDILDAVADRLRAGRVRLRTMGGDYLAFAMLDAVVDSYNITLAVIADRLDAVEEQLITGQNQKTLHAIYRAKRELLFLRKAIRPVRDVAGQLIKEESLYMGKAVRLYMRDVQDHVMQALDTMDALRDFLTVMHEVYLSNESMRVNEVMKVLTVIATIFIPLTFIAGVYGMNFKYMPELDWPWAYPAVLGLMACIALGMVTYFVRKRWF